MAKDPTKAGTKIEVNRRLKCTSTKAVSVKKKAKYDSQTIAWIQPNQKVSAISKKNGFYYIESLGGWVDAVYFEIVRDYGNVQAEYKSEAEKQAEILREEKKARQDDKKRTRQEANAGYDIYAKYINSQYEENAGATLSASDLNGVYGLPYQFPEFVDPKVYEGDNKLPYGKIYTERIIDRLPLLILSPGKVEFMKDYKDSEKLPVIEALLGGTEKAGTVGDFLSKPGKYYTFAYDSANYWEYVNTMNSACATYLGIQDETITINGGKPTKLRNFKWENATNGKFDSLILSSEDYVCFYVDSSSSKSEDFSNSTTESSLVGKVNGYSDTAKEIKFLTGAITGNNFLNDQNIVDLTSKLADISENLLNGSTILSNVGKDFAIIAAGGKLVFPEIWSDSEFSQSFDINIKLRCPCPNPLQWFLDIIVPLNHLIAFTMPRTPFGHTSVKNQVFDNTVNGYVSPFLVRGFYKGLFNCDMGIITSLQITKGKEGSWTRMGLPSEVDVSITIKDLYNIMVMTADTMPSTFISNTCFLNYLANSCGICINQPDISRSIELYYTVYTKKLTRALTGYRFWKNLQQDGRNKAYALYTRFFKG